jgi:hypothetical protein
MLTPNQAPPEAYYQNNCVELFAFTMDRYADLLPRKVLSDVGCYLQASNSAQRLFARLLTRKRRFVRVDSLNYAEVANVTAAIAELADCGLVKVAPRTNADAILPLLKKEEIHNVWPHLDKRSRKSDLVDKILGSYSDQHIYKRLQTRLAWLAIADPASWDLMRLLYFGDEAQDWATFVLRDLGMTRYEEVPLDRRQFTDSAELGTFLEYRQLHHYAHRVSEHPALAPFLLDSLDQEVDNRFAERRRKRAVLHIGRRCEQAGLFTIAVRAYDTVRMHPARERAVRVVAKMDGKQGCADRLEEIRRSPLSEEEAQFAERFGKRKAGFQPPTTIVDIQTPPVAVEAEALAMLIANGGWGMHVESGLVRTLTGLIYWPVLYAAVPGAFTNPFQIGPNDLVAEDFVDVRKALIDEIESATASDAAFVDQLYTTACVKQGVTNALVNWQILERAQLLDIISAMPVEHMRRLTQFYIRNLNERRSGLPDLFVAYGPGDYEFVEVKGPNDQLQPGQRVWFRHLRELGIPARVLKLRLVG